MHVGSAARLPSISLLGRLRSACQSQPTKNIPKLREHVTTSCAANLSANIAQGSEKTSRQVLQEHVYTASLKNVRAYPLDDQCTRPSTSNACNTLQYMTSSFHSRSEHRTKIGRSQHNEPRHVEQQLRSKNTPHNCEQPVSRSSSVTALLHDFADAEIDLQPCRACNKVQHQ